MNKTRIAFILLCCCMIEGAFAQVIEINGGVKEARTNGTLEFANVVLQTIDSTFVMGTTTDNKGYFVLKGELKGDYLLVVSSLGYKICLPQWFRKGCRSGEYRFGRGSRTFG